MVGTFKKDTQKGFTIIEVLIVLAIAGLIMLIVFLAVPNLQRNSRNTQRRSDVSTILGAIQETLNNNGGLLSGITQPNINSAAGNLAYYDISGSNLTVVDGSSAKKTNPSDVDKITVVTGAQCDSSSIGDSVAGNKRQIAVLYTVEAGSGGKTKVCTGS